MQQQHCFFCVFSNCHLNLLVACVPKNSKTLETSAVLNADELSGQPSTYILFVLQFIGSAIVHQPEYVNELSSSCRQSLRVGLCFLWFAQAALFKNFLMSWLHPFAGILSPCEVARTQRYHCSQIEVFDFRLRWLDNYHV